MRDWDWKIGEVGSVPMRWKNGDTNEPYLLTGYQIRGYFYGSGWGHFVNAVVSDAAGGKFTMPMPSNVTSSMTLGFTQHLRLEYNNGADWYRMTDNDIPINGT